MPEDNMRKYLLVLISCAVGATVLATPDVMCEMTLSSDGPEENKYVQIRATPDGATATLAGFTVTAKIEAIRPAGMGNVPIAGYSLGVNIDNEKAQCQNYMSVRVGAKKDRYSTALKFQHLTAFVNCDVLN
jgi:hypothetical protein